MQPPHESDPPAPGPASLRPASPGAAARDLAPEDDAPRAPDEVDAESGSGTGEGLRPGDADELEAPAEPEATSAAVGAVRTEGAEHSEDTGDAEDPGPRATPWRDNLEALTVAIIMALALKAFLLEAYKIPTGSMQPTLMGDDDSGVFDRILVDKLSYQFRDPARFEVAVFRYPLDRSKNFVKRIVGLPGEELKIEAGDLWTRPDGDAPWTILRRPRAVQAETWKSLDPADSDFPRWHALSGDDWSFEGHTVRARGAGLARWGRGEHSVMDEYVHGYPEGLLDLVRRRPEKTENPVGDLRLQGRVTALEGCEAVSVELREGGRTYSLQLPGPAAPEDARPSIRVRSGDVSRVAENSSTSESTTTRATAPYRLPAGREVTFGAQNLDDLLELEVGGEVLVSAEVEPVRYGRAVTSIGLGQIGAGADFDDLETFRDIYYLDEGVSQIAIPEGKYYALGDNTQDSSDSRAWRYVHFRVRTGPGEDVTLRGNSREGRRRDGRQVDDANPRYGDEGGPRGQLVFLRDEWGELHVFPRRDVIGTTYSQESLVDRELISGRALAVFWPLRPDLGVYRLRWVH